MLNLAPKLLFNNYRSINDRVPYINSGGCGIFAEKLYRILVKFGLKPKILIMCKDVSGMKQRILGVDVWGGSLYHVVIKLGSKYYDSEGIYSDHNAINHTYGETELLNLEIDTLSKWNKEPWRWNETFDRTQTNSIETELIKAYLNVKRQIKLKSSKIN